MNQCELLIYGVAAFVHTVLRVSRFLKAGHDQRGLVAIDKFNKREIFQVRQGSLLVITSELELRRKTLERLWCISGRRGRGNNRGMTLCELRVARSRWLLIPFRMSRERSESGKKS